MPIPAGLLNPTDTGLNLAGSEINPGQRMLCHHLPISYVAAPEVA
jgi:hypothetical protein